MNDSMYHLIDLCAKQTNAQVYLVGGCIRDLILNRPILDIDLLVYGNEEFIALLRQRIPSTLICLDKDRDIFRLALRRMRSNATIDITLQTEDVPLLQNLGERDFTMNAMAIKSEDIMDLKLQPLSEMLIDPFGGRQDIEKGIIRMIRSENFLNDPLRLCRAFRLGAQFGFRIHSKTHDAIFENAKFINLVSPERIHEEWGKLMLTSHAAAYIEEMKKAGLLVQIFPEIRHMDGVDQGDRHALGLWEHSWSTLYHIEEMIRAPNVYLTPTLNALLVQRLKEPHTNRIFCLKMAALFHDLGKPQVKGVGRKGQVTFYGHASAGVRMLRTRMRALRFSNEEIYCTIRLIQDHMRPFLLSQLKQVTPRTMARLFIHLGETWPALFLLSVADVMSTKSDRNEAKAYIGFVDSLCACMEKMEEKAQQAPLVTGRDLIENIGLPPGPLIGKALSSINQAYLSQKINTRQEALKMARSFLAQARDKPAT